MILRVAACQIDIALVVDCSGSIRKANEPGEDNWQYVIDFMIELISITNVGEDDSHVAAVSFGMQLKHNRDFRGYTVFYISLL